MLYRLLKVLLTPILKGYNRVEVYSSKDIPKTGSFVLIANHVSYLDPIYIGVFFPRKLHFMAKKESFSNRVLRWLLLQLGAFPVDRNRADIKAIKQAISIIKSGKVLAIFPQGTRKKELEGDDVKQGAAYFSIKTNVPIIPVYIAGTEKVMAKGSWMIKPSKVKIYIGEPIISLREDHQKTDDLLDQITDKIKTSLFELSQLDLKEGIKGKA